jgi:hypothetical protein
MLILIGLLFVGTILVAYGTAVKNRWGINLAPAPDCPLIGEGAVGPHTSLVRPVFVGWSNVPELWL